MLQLIVSRTGYGKTTFIQNKIKELVQNKKEAVLIIPEQISFESERDILRAVGAKNLQYVNVMSFSRFCSLFFAKYGGRDKPYIDSVGKTAIMQEVLKTLAPSLDLFRKSATTTQFCSLMLSLSQKTKQNAVTPDMLSVTAQTSSGILKQKLTEISLILSEYDKKISKDYFDPADDLSVVAKSLPENPFFAGKTVFIDSFTGITTAQLNIIEQIIKTAENTYVSLGFDGVYSKDSFSCFANISKFALELKTLARDNSVEVGEDILLLKNQRTNSQALDFLEKNIFADDKSGFLDETQDVFVTKTKNVYEEAEYVAKSIKKLVSAGEIRYRDISVISRDASLYNGIIDEIFSRYDIPVFVDDRQGVENLSIFRLAVYALSACISKFDSSDVISLLKTGVLNVDPQSAEKFELYVNVWRINKNQFEQPFDLPLKSFLSGDDEYFEKTIQEIEQTRKAIIDPLVEFNKKKGSTVGSYIKALYALVSRYECARTLKENAKALENNGLLRLSETTQKSYDVFIHILDQLYLALGESEMELKKFYELFCSVIASIDLGSVPQGLDAVAVGSAERMRPKSPKITFVIGANEGVFPSTAQGSGLFSDDELSRLKQKGIELPFYDIQTAIDEQYLAYCALCSASQKLYVSYVSSSVAGEPQEPSVIVDEITSIFPNIEIKEYDKNEIVSVDDALKAYAQSCGQDREIEEYFKLHPNEKFYELKKSMTNKLINLSPDTAKNLYSNNIYASATKIETYNKCAFSYFCKYGLKLKEIREAKVDNVSRGSLIHFVLEKMINSLTYQEFFELSDEQIKEKITYFSNEFLEKQVTAGQKQTSIEQYKMLRLNELIKIIVTRVFKDLEQSEYTPVASELSFGGETPTIPAYTVDIKDGKVILTGYIDRIDSAEHDGKKYVRIIDYKTYTKDFTLSDMLYGQNLQMALYMKALQENSKDLLGEFLPGGMFYLPAKDEKIDLERVPKDKVESKRLSKLKLVGMFLSDDDAYVLHEPECAGLYAPTKLNKEGFAYKNVDYTKQQYDILSRYLDLKIKQTAQNILSGKTVPNPMDSAKDDACKYCAYFDVCKFKDLHQKAQKQDNVDVFRQMLEELEGQGE